MKVIKIKSEKKEYKLKMTRASVRYAEEILGFDLNTAGTKLLSSTSKLFNAAFFAEHGVLTMDETDVIFEGLKGKEGLIKALQEMYMEVIGAFVGETDGEEKNITWEIVQ